jgi:hypothetical protein
MFLINKNQFFSHQAWRRFYQNEFYSCEGAGLHEFSCKCGINPSLSVTTANGEFPLAANGGSFSQQAVNL